MQFSHFESMVRHAVLAIGSLYEDISNGHRITRQSGFAISHYNAALKQISSVENEQLILLLCVLFICIEYLLGNIDTALQHTRYGIMILNESRCPSWAQIHLVPIFRRLSLIPMFGGAKSMCFPKLTGFDTLIPVALSSVSEAQAVIDDLVAQVLETVLGGCAVKRTKLANMLDMWNSDIAKLEATTPISLIDNYAIYGMRIKYQIAKIHLETPMEHTEVWFDKYLDAFQCVIDLAGKASQLWAILERQHTIRSSFTFEACLLPLLFFVVSKCRSLETRLQGLTHMAQVGPAKEGLFDSITLYQVGRRVIELEHGLSLHDSRDNCTSNDPFQLQGWPGSAQFPPEEMRIIAVSMSHELGIVAGNKYSTTCYRRQVCFLMKGIEGKVYARKEYMYSTV